MSTEGVEDNSESAHFDGVDGVDVRNIDDVGDGL